MNLTIRILIIISADTRDFLLRYWHGIKDFNVRLSILTETKS